MGLRTRIRLGFIAIGVLLLFVGTASYFEVRRLHTAIKSLVTDDAQKNIMMDNLLSVLIRQDNIVNDYLLTGDTELFCAQTASNLDEMGKVVNKMKQFDKNGSRLNGMENAIRYYRTIADSSYIMTVEEISGKMSWYDNHLSVAANELKTDIRNYINVTQSEYMNMAQGHIRTVYRSDIRILIALSTCFVILMMFYALINIFYLKPVVGMKKALDRYILEDKEYYVKSEAQDEVKDLEGYVEYLVQDIENRKQSDSQS